MDNPQCSIKHDEDHLKNSLLNLMFENSVVTLKTPCGFPQGFSETPNIKISSRFPHSEAAREMVRWIALLEVFIF